MSAPSYNSQDRRIMRDVTVMALSSLPAGGGGSPGTAVDYLGVIETLEVSLKREFVQTEASSDGAVYSRATRWGNGSVKISGFSASTSSKFFALFAAGSHASFAFTEIATGDSFALLCRNDEASKSVGKDATKDSLSLTQEGVPFYGAAGATPAAMTLD